MPPFGMAKTISSYIKTISKHCVPPFSIAKTSILKIVKTNSKVYSSITARLECPAQLDCSDKLIGDYPHIGKSAVEVVPEISGVVL